MGSIIRVRRVDGLGELNNPASPMGAALPAVLGAGAAAATTIGLRYLMTPKNDMQMKLMEYAPYVGLGTGLLAALGLGYSSGRPAGIGAGAGAGVVTLIMVISEAAARSRLKAVASGETTDAMRPYGLGHGPTGAIVPEYATPANTGNGMGVLTWQRDRNMSGKRGVGAYGDFVNLGSVNPNAFGTPGFVVSGRRH